MSINSAWPCCPQAANFLENTCDRFLAANPRVQSMSDTMLRKAGVAIKDLVDHWTLPDSPEIRQTLFDAGFEHRLTGDADPVWLCPNARLARVRLSGDINTVRMALAVEDITAFEDAWNLPSAGRHGDVDSGYEEAHWNLTAGELAAVVRIGYGGFRPGDLSATYQRAIHQIRLRLRGRDRGTPDDAIGAINTAAELLKGVVEEIGAERAADEFFAAEREYYTSRNRAAALQCNLQCELGIGWANQDHHTYRSSREAFISLMGLWEILGFTMRERYYAGAEAGWGAQIVEHPVSRVVIFSDVDLAPDELNIDFSSEPLAGRSDMNLGTIGLWCALHGDSIGCAGMHHLECEYDFDAVSESLAAVDIGVMPPFTDLPVLKQAFTNAEVWSVAADHLKLLEFRGDISSEQADRFSRCGAAGSHLEILQRREGFKGFNKTGVSAIILATDARN